MNLEILSEASHDAYPGMAKRIIDDLEKPLFSPMGQSVPYDVPSLLRVMRAPQSHIIVAWENEDEPLGSLVGYNIGLPFEQVPQNLKATAKNFVPLAGGDPLPQPNKETWYHDTIAVAVYEQRKGVGTAMLNLSLAHALTHGFRSWAVFLSLHNSSRSRMLYDKHPVFASIQKQGGLIQEEVMHRGAKTNYRLYDLTLTSIQTPQE